VGTGRIVLQRSDIFIFESCIQNTYILGLKQQLKRTNPIYFYKKE